MNTFDAHLQNYRDAMAGLKAVFGHSNERDEEAAIRPKTMEEIWFDIEDNSIDLNPDNGWIDEDGLADVVHSVLVLAQMMSINPADVIRKAKGGLK